MFRHYLRLFLFCAALLVGIQLPGFVDQYGKSLQAHYLESDRSVSEFRADAKRFFQGDLDALAKHYVKNNDAIISKGGENIQTLIERNRVLTKAWTRFQTSTLQAFMQTYFYPVEDIRLESWQSYGFMVRFDPTSIVCGLVAALLLSVFFDLLLSFFAWLWRKISGGKAKRRETLV